LLLIENLHKDHDKSSKTAEDLRIKQCWSCEDSP
jgi:hypothetical protein